MEPFLRELKNLCSLGVGKSSNPIRRWLNLLQLIHWAVVVSLNRQIALCNSRLNPNLYGSESKFAPFLRQFSVTYIHTRFALDSWNFVTFTINSWQSIWCNFWSSGPKLLLWLHYFWHVLSWNWPQTRKNFPRLWKIVQESNFWAKDMNVPLYSFPRKWTQLVRSIWTLATCPLSWYWHSESHVV